VSRTVAWWSAGAASTAAAWLALQEDPEALICYCDTSSTEHPDNLRFLADCENLFGTNIARLTSDRYADIWDVFRLRRYLVGPYGAQCTVVLKKDVRRKFQEPGDLQIFGFTSDEEGRASRFEKQNPDVDCWFPLIDEGWTKQDCLRFISDRGIEIPAMYRLGYRNNNCVGCVKGGAGYWNKIRRDFPETFDRMAAVERELGATINKSRVGGPAVRVYLDELDPAAGKYESELDVECGVGCSVPWKQLQLGMDGGK
jgi:3'-phosphoadenosine 5'-phosphosulfate sulfotransferase (PAPS reductase)/FAD synthetase